MQCFFFFLSQFRHVGELSPSEEVNKCHKITTVHSVQTCGFQWLSGEQLTGHNLQDRPKKSVFHVVELIWIDCWAVSTKHPSWLQWDYYFISLLLGCVGSFWHLNGASGCGGSWQTHRYWAENWTRANRATELCLMQDPDARLQWMVPLCVPEISVSL